MARRNLRNLDERILKKVVHYGAERGLSHVSTKKIAIDLKITEPTIYVHFSTKVNLLYEAYLYAFSKIYEEIAGDPRGYMEGKLSDFLKKAAENPEAAAYIEGYRNYLKTIFDETHPDPMHKLAKDYIASFGKNSDWILPVLADAFTSFAMLAARGTINPADPYVDRLGIALREGLISVLD